MVARDQLISDAERLAPERGLKEAVAVIRGATQADSSALLFISTRNLLQSVEMPEGIRVMFD